MSHAEARFRKNSKSGRRDDLFAFAMRVTAVLFMRRMRPSLM